MSKIPIHSYKGDKDKKIVVGHVENNIYYSERNPDFHYFIIFRGFGLSIDVYNILINMGVEIIRLYYGNTIYESNISQWKHSSRWDNEINKTNKIDPQYILELSQMNIYEMKGGIDKMAEIIDYEKVGAIQSAGVDLVKYDKQITTIEKSEALQMPSTFTPFIPGTQQHYMQWVLKVSSVVLESIREGEDKIEFRATELFNLVQDDKGNLKGFPTGEGAKLMKFMKDLKIPSPEKLKSLKEVMEAVKGKQAVIKADTKSKDGKTNTYLRFRY
jgi:hypothetical protein